MMYRVVLSALVVVAVLLGLFLHGEKDDKTTTTQQPQQSQQSNPDAEGLKGFKIP